jgi:acetyl/propionyl-CoA carboxylase alpha subunit
VYRKLLVANRGEIAVRVIRTCRELGIPTVAVYSEADRQALHVRVADEAVCVGPSRAAASYLAVENVIAAAKQSGAQAVHPGYGFLAGSPRFVARCRQERLVFVGPSPEVLETLADASLTRARVKAAGVPTPSDTNDGTVGARQVGVQVLADGHGNVVHLGEWERTLERCGQALVEEAPSSAVSPELRQRLGAAAARAARALDFRGAGTVTFLLDGMGGFAFLEMSPHLEAEHPLAEVLTGRDLVREMLSIAVGAPLGLAQADARLDGHAIQCRVYAQDPTADFQPSPGRIQVFQAPAGEGLRVDAGYAAGAEVPIFYDSLLAKLIAWGPERASAGQRLREALADFRVSGVRTNIPFVAWAIQPDSFTRGEASADLLQGWLGSLHGSVPA